MSVYDVQSLVASIENSLLDGNFLSATTKVVSLKKALGEFNLSAMAEPLIHDIAVLQSKKKHEQDVSVIAAKLKEIETAVSRFV